MALVLIVCCVAIAAMLTLALTEHKLHPKHPSVRIFWAAPLCGAALLLLCGVLSPADVLRAFTADSAVNPIKILVLFFAMTLMSVFLDEVGFFRYMAGVVLSHAGTNQRKLFLLLYAAVSVLTLFTSNDIVVLTFTPFICYFTKSARIDPIPYLFAEFVAANTWSMALVIGNPTNIYLAGGAGIGFFPYLRVMLLPTVAAGLVSLAVLLLLFRRPLALPMSPIPAEVTFRRRAPLVIGLVHLSLCTLLLAVSSYVGLDMWLIALGFSLSLFLFGAIAALLDRRRPFELLRTLLRLPYQLIPFVLAMFTLVLALRAYGVSKEIFTSLAALPAIPTYGVLSFLSANLLNNIPMSVLFSSILSFSEKTSLGGVYASIVGSNLGAYLTPLGALAGIMWSSLLLQNGVRLSFRRFVGYGALVAIPTLAAALLSLVLVTA